MEIEETTRGAGAIAMLNSLINQHQLTDEESEYAFKLLGRILLAKNKFELPPALCARLPFIYFQHNAYSIIKLMLKPDPDFLSVAESFGDDFGRELFLLWNELKNVYNTANRLGYAPLMDDLYTVADFPFEVFLNAIKAGSQRQELEMLDAKFDKEEEEWRFDQFGKALRVQIKEKQPDAYLELLQNGSLNEFLSGWEEKHWLEVDKVVTNEITGEEANKIVWPGSMQLALMNVYFFLDEKNGGVRKDYN
jgi:hypothetical protein